MKAHLFMLSICSLCLLSACGGGGGGSQLVVTHFSVIAPTNTTAGTAFNFTVTALDASNNVVTNYSGIVHLSLIHISEPTRP